MGQAAPPALPVKSELETRYQLPVAGLRVERGRVDVTEAGNRVARVATHQGALRTGDGRVGEVRAVEDVEEFRPNFERHPLSNVEPAGNVHLFVGAPLIAEVGIVRRRGSPRSGSGIGPCRRVQDKVAIRIDAVTVEV